jgi:hypothetical protein
MAGVCKSNYSPKNLRPKRSTIFPTYSMKSCRTTSRFPPSQNNPVCSICIAMVVSTSTFILTGDGKFLTILNRNSSAPSSVGFQGLVPGMGIEISCPLSAMILKRTGRTLFLATICTRCLSMMSNLCRTQSRSLAPFPVEYGCKPSISAKANGLTNGVTFPFAMPRNSA